MKVRPVELAGRVSGDCFRECVCVRKVFSFLFKHSEQRAFHIVTFTLLILHLPRHIFIHTTKWSVVYITDIYLALIKKVGMILFYLLFLVNDPTVY